MSKHTPAPWTIDTDGWIVSSEDRFAICLIDASRDFDQFDPVDKANATLIAASPAMLVALKQALAAMMNQDRYDANAVDALEEAIKLAEPTP